MGRPCFNDFQCGAAGFDFGGGHDPFNNYKRIGAKVRKAKLARVVKKWKRTRKMAEHVRHEILAGRIPQGDEQEELLTSIDKVDRTSDRRINLKPRKTSARW